MSPSTIEAVRKAGQDPLNVGAEGQGPSLQGRIVIDALVGCGAGGLHVDLYLESGATVHAWPLERHTFRKGFHILLVSTQIAGLVFCTHLLPISLCGVVGCMVISF